MSSDSTTMEGADDKPDLPLDYFDGVYLLAIDTIVSPGLPFQFVVDVEIETDATNSGTIAVLIQPLSLDPMSTTLPREEIGDPIALEADIIEGAFTLAFGETMITGAANPITGSDILADLTLEGLLYSYDLLCGDTLGAVLSPIGAPLAGSTFAAMRLEDREERPLVFPLSCEDAGIGG